MTPSTVTADLGDSRTLTCSAEPGNHDNTEFQWYFDNGSTREDEGIGSNLNLDFTSLCMAGSYICVPSNDIGKAAEGSATVNIKGQKFYTNPFI